MLAGLFAGTRHPEEASDRLSGVAVGRTVTVRALAEGADGHRLTEMGVGAGSRVRVLCAGDPFVCQVGECRIGLCRDLAHCVFVDGAT